MRHAGDVKDLRWAAALRACQGVIAGVAIRVQPTFEVLQVLPRPLALTVRRVAVERCRCARPMPRSWVKGVDPEPWRPSAGRSWRCTPSPGPQPCAGQA
jgi:hypothetical protein